MISKGKDEDKPWLALSGLFSRYHNMAFPNQHPLPCTNRERFWKECVDHERNKRSEVSLILGPLSPRLERRPLFRRSKGGPIKSLRHDLFLSPTSACWAAMECHLTGTQHTCETYHISVTQVKALIRNVSFSYLGPKPSK